MSDLQSIEIDALRLRIHDLERIISGDHVRYQSLGLTARDSVVLGAFIRREALTYDNINTLISDPLDDSGGLGWDALRHMVWRLRLRLRACDPRIEIRPVRGRCYFMPAASKAIVAGLVKTG